MTQNTNKEILKLLQSTDKETVLNTLSNIREDGNDQLLQALIQTYTEHHDNEIRNKISGIFNDLKNQSSAKIVVELIQDTELDDVKKMLLASCWQSRLNYSDYLEIFMDFVGQSAFELSFEAFTIIENIEIKISHERKHELLHYAQHTIKSCKEENLAFASDLEPIVANYEEL